MIPKNHFELEIIFLLEELKEAKKRADLPLSMHGTANMQRIAVSQFLRLRDDYMAMVEKYYK